jgi:ATP-dependent exoDNAse (exonuclease V) beta subunit
MNTSGQPLDPFANVEILASAGTGKTYTLSVRFLGLLNAGVPVDQILATTFTRKAAGEISGRLFERLAEAVLDKKKQAQLAGDLGDPSLDAGRCQALLIKLNRNLHRLRVGTLDSYFAQVARNYCFEMSLPPDWNIIDTVREGELITRSIEEVIQSHLDSSTLQLEHLLPRGASQRSLSDLVAETVKNHYSLYRRTDSNCWSTITAEGRLSQSEIKQLLKQIADAPLPQHKGVKKARDADIDRAREDDWEKLLTTGIMKAIAKAGDGEVVNFSSREIPEDTVGLYRRLMAHAVSLLLQPVIRQTAATYDLLDHYHQVFFTAKRQDGSLSFDDVAFALHGYLAQPAGLGSGFRLDATVEHLLLDEFQDTSLLQWQILLPLAQHATADAPAASSRSFFFVGDTKQAIFGWRGGRREIFQVVHKDLAITLGKTNLDKSYRSAQPIIDAVNHVFQNLTAHDNLEDLFDATARWQEDFPPHKTVHSERKGGVEFLHLPSGTVNEDHHATSLESMAQIVAKISTHAPDASIGVLTRKNNFAYRAIQKLRSEGLEVSGESGVSLDDTSPNQAILSLLALVDHPGDRISQYHVAHSPLGAIVGLTADDSQEQVTVLAEGIRKKIQQGGYGPYLEELSVAVRESCSRRQFERLNQLVNMAYDFQPVYPTRTREFREHIQLSTIEDPSSARIRVMTVHGAKGLEFDAVVLPQLNESIGSSSNYYVTGRPESTDPIDRVLAYFNKPLQKALPPRIWQMFQDARDEQVYDALCVLYVAFTRAKHGLHVILPYNPGRKKYPKTLSGLVEAAIGAPINPDSEVEISSFGDPAWYLDFTLEAEDDGPSGACGTAPVRLAEITPGLSVPAPPAGRRPEPVTPSSQEGEGVFQAGELLDLGQEKAMTRGTLIHGWLEQVQWLDEGLPSEEAMKRDVQRYQVDSSAIDYFREVIQHPQVTRLLDRDSYLDLSAAECCESLREALQQSSFELQAYQEFALSALHEGQHFHGTIDRLVLVIREGVIVGADIVDYKTDSIDPDNPERTVEARCDYYRGQLKTYAQGLSSSMRIPLEMINTRLAFVGAGIVTRVDHH